MGNAPVRPTPEQMAEFKNVSPPPPPPPRRNWRGGFFRVPVMRVTEGAVKKGGVNEPPTTPRPSPPASQGSGGLREKHYELLHDSPMPGHRDKFRFAAPTTGGGKLTVEVRRDKWNWIVEFNDGESKITVSLQPWENCNGRCSNGD